MMDSEDILHAIRDLDPDVEARRRDPDAYTSHDELVEALMRNPAFRRDLETAKQCEDCRTLEGCLRVVERKNKGLVWGLVVSMATSALAIAWGVSRG